MRLQKSIKIDDREYTIKELTVEEIITLFSKSGINDGSNPQTEVESAENKITSVIGQVFGMGGYLKDFLKVAMPGTELTHLVKLAPSELMTIWDAVKEINTHFFEMAQKLELGQTLTESATEVIRTFLKHVVALSQEAMEEEFGITDTPSS